MKQINNAIRMFNEIENQERELQDKKHKLLEYIESQRKANSIASELGLLEDSGDLTAKSPEMPMQRPLIPSTESFRDRTRRIAYEEMRNNGAGWSIRTRELIPLIETDGFRIGAKDKITVVSHALGTDGRFISDRKHGWRLKENASSASADDASKENKKSKSLPKGTILGTHSEGESSESHSEGKVSEGGYQVA